MNEVADIPCLQARSPVQGPDQSKESTVPANSLAVSYPSSLKSHHFTITVFPSQGSPLCILAADNSQFRLPQQNLGFLQETEAGKLSCRGRGQTEQAIPGHCRDETAPAGLWKCPAVLPDCEHKGKGPREESVSSLLLFTQQCYDKQM